MRFANETVPLKLVVYYKCFYFSNRISLVNRQLEHLFLEKNLKCRIYKLNMEYCIKTHKKFVNYGTVNRKKLKILCYLFRVKKLTNS